MRIATLLAAVTLGLGGSLAAPAPAEAHTSTCSHYGAGYYVYTPNGKVYYEDLYIAGYGVGPHYHSYRTRKKTYTNGVGWSAYTIVHYHDGRACPGHPF